MRFEQWFYTVPLRLRSLFRRRRVEEDLDAELQYHLGMKIDQYLAKGMSPTEARRSAMIDMGGIELRKEECRDMRRVGLVEDLLQDFRYGFRILRKNPGFTAAAVLTLSFGIGANTAIFSVVNGVLWHSLPFKDPQRLVQVFETTRESSMTYADPADFDEWRSSSHSFDGMAAVRNSKVNLTGGAPEKVGSMSVTADFFSLVGTHAAVGRLFSEEYKSAESYLVVISHDLWQRRLGGDPSAIGQSLALDGKSYSIIGILPREFTIGDALRGPIDCWFRQDPRADQTRSGHTLIVIARLRQNIVIERAQAEMDLIAQRLQREFPKTNAGCGIKLVSLYEVVVGDVHKQVLVLAGAVALVLLIACANVASLLIARGANRSRELAVRSSLGAVRARLVRQLLTESILLAFFGGLLGLVLASWGLKALIGLSPQNLPGLDAIGIDWTVFVFLVAASLITGLVCGIVPAFQGSRADLVPGLKETRSPGTRRRRFSRLLVVVEISLSLVLLVAAGLLINSFIRLHGVPSGFDPGNVLTLRVSPSGSKYLKGKVYDSNLIQQTYLQLLEKLEQLPGADTAAIGSIPFSGGMPVRIYVEAREAPVELNIHPVSPDYFRVLRIQQIAGRTFTNQDVPSTYPAVAIINRATAQSIWPGQSPIGKKISFSRPKNPAEMQWTTIVGVVDDVRHRGLEGPVEESIYTLFPQFRGAIGGGLLIRTSGNPSDLIAGVKQTVWSIDKEQPITRIETLEQSLARSDMPRRFNLLLISIFAVAAVALAAIGIYGVMAYSVSSRTNEIGIRLALGAAMPNVVGLFLRQSLSLIFVGEGIGVAGALILNRMMSKMVFGVTTTDPATYISACTLWALVGMVATYLPAHRAARVDAMTALRCE
ncbi:MAG: ABC transporter permease [Acidobacteriia bacterium]|nr:ABC transporter permease [Terriglobia bacterium]